MLHRYLPSVVEHTPLSSLQANDIEVVVADNGSTDNSLEVLEQFPSVRVISFSNNYGFAEGYNRALSLIDSTYSVLLNSDVEVTEGWLTPLLDYMDAHPDVAACQPKIRSWLHKDRFEHAGAAGGMLDYLGYPYCRGRVFGKTETDKGQYDKITDVFWASGACMCIRTASYKETGGLDAGFFAHMEEIDLCWRLLCRGQRVVCIPQSTVFHLGGGALNYENPQKTYLNFRNNLLMLFKNLPDNRLRRVMFLRRWLDYMAALQLLLTGKPRNAWAVCRARNDFRKMLHSTSLQQKRLRNQKEAIVPYPAIISRKSLFRIALLGKKNS